MKHFFTHLRFNRPIWRFSGELRNLRIVCDCVINFVFPASCWITFTNYWKCSSFLLSGCVLGIGSMQQLGSSVCSWLMMKWEITYLSSSGVTFSPNGKSDIRCVLQTHPYYWEFIVSMKILGMLSPVTYCTPCLCSYYSPERWIPLYQMVS